VDLVANRYTYRRCDKGRPPEFEHLVERPEEIYRLVPVNRVDPHLFALCFILHASIVAQAH
jgi:hypothetical protein